MRRNAEQINGREGETATLLSRSPLKFELCAGGFAPRHLNRYAFSMNLKRAATFWTFYPLPSEQLPEIASDALAEGYDSPSLRTLAGVTNPIMSEVEPLFRKALDELSIPIPDFSDSGKSIALYYAKAIVSGDVSPYEGARTLWNIYNEDKVEIHNELLVFVGLASEYEDAEIYMNNGNLEYKQYLTEITEHIILEAKKFVEKHSA